MRVSIGKQAFEPSFTNGEAEGHSRPMMATADAVGRAKPIMRPIAVARARASAPNALDLAVFWAVIGTQVAMSTGLGAEAPMARRQTEPEAMSGALSPTSVSRLHWKTERLVLRGLSVGA